MEATKVFFGYASRPEIRRETLSFAASRLGELAHIDVASWEDLRVSGHIVIDEIFRAIDETQIAVFDVSSLNQNVLFELGYAIGRDKRIRLTFDESDETAAEGWRQFRTLTTVGFIKYTNSDEIYSKFLSETPHEDEKSLFDSLIRGSLTPLRTPNLFYLPSAQETEPGRQLTRMIFAEAKKRNLPVVVADPEESTPPTLPWYAQKIYSSIAVIVHFSAGFRRNAAMHNARSALVAGLSVGMERRVLMLSESDYADPIDYRDFLHVYANARTCVDAAREWIDQNLPTREQVAGLRPERVSVDLETELRSVRLGEHVAENEADSLADYFVETSSYKQVLQDRVTVFVGRKGSGKTANLIRAAEELRGDARNIVCVIKPHGYELEGLLRLLSRFDERDLSRFMVEALWKYLLYSEIAISTAAEARSLPPAAVSGTPAATLLQYVEDQAHGLNDEFAVRLERAVLELESASVSREGIGEARRVISERLHAGSIREIRRLLREAIASGRRVAVLVDNLDKAWDRTSDAEQLSRMILGLLVAIGDVAEELAQEEGELSALTVSLSVFLRSDIYRYVVRVAREPDKLPVTQINWENPAVLLRIIEERYASVRPDHPGEEIWERFFCEAVHGIPTTEYILRRVLPRPRDMVFFCNEAIVAAANAGHTKVEEEDIVEAENSYSQFVFESILVENGLSLEQLEDVLYEFAGSRPQFDSAKAIEAIETAGIVGDASGDVLRRLRELAFLGVEVRPGDFSFDESAPGMARDDVLSRKLSEGLRRPFQMSIHPAFRPYLEVADE